jgi:hypothetical protein
MWKSEEKKEYVIYRSLCTFGLFIRVQDLNLDYLKNVFYSEYGRMRVYLTELSPNAVFTASLRKILFNIIHTFIPQCPCHLFLSRCPLKRIEGLATIMHFVLPITLSLNMCFKTRSMRLVVKFHQSRLYSTPHSRVSSV